MCIYSLQAIHPKSTKQKEKKHIIIMEKKIKQISSLHGFVFTTLLILPIAWSASKCNDVQPIEVGPGASPDHLIPANGNDVKSWFSKTILHAK